VLKTTQSRHEAFQSQFLTGCEFPLFSFTSLPDFRCVVGVYCETRSIFTGTANQNSASFQLNDTLSYLLFDYFRRAVFRFTSVLTYSDRYI
jgi:hypothetical protein